VIENNIVMVKTEKIDLLEISAVQLYLSGIISCSTSSSTKRNNINIIEYVLSKPRENVIDIIIIMIIFNDQH